MIETMSGMGLEPDIWGFLALYLGLILGHMAVHFGFGALLSLVNRRFPWRKIQSKETRVYAVTEIRQSWSGFLGTPFCMALGLWTQVIGWGPGPAQLTLWSLVGFFLLLTLLHDIWFYWIHRLMHTRPMVRWHRVHHMSPVPTVWSNDRFTLPDVLLTQCFLFLAPLVMPVPAVALILYRLSDQIKGIIGHSGYEYAASPFAVWPMPFVCVKHHDAHHELYHVNFGNTLSIWDRLFGTLEPDYDNKVKALRARLKARQAV